MKNCYVVHSSIIVLFNQRYFYVYNTSFGKIIVSSYNYNCDYLFSKISSLLFVINDWSLIILINRYKLLFFIKIKWAFIAINGQNTIM